MKTVSFQTGYRVRVDGKRRPTLPASLFAESGIDPTHELVAHADGEGRILLEDPMVVLAAFQAQVAEGLRVNGGHGSMEDDLLRERTTDKSLED